MPTRASAADLGVRPTLADLSHGISESINGATVTVGHAQSLPCYHKKSPYVPAFLQHPDTTGAAIRASRRQHRQDVYLRTYGLRFRAHRQFPHLRLLRFAAPLAACFRVQ